jgi:hypothetical protein
MRTVFACLILFYALAVHAEETLKLSVIKIDGERFEKYSDDRGSIYLPSRVFTLDEKVGNSLCDDDLTDHEVLVLRENVPLKEGSIQDQAKLAEAVKVCGKSREAQAPKAKASEDKVKYEVGTSKEGDKKAKMKAILPNGGSFSVEGKPDTEKKKPE